MSKSVVISSCGCFFTGREFHVDPKCKEHNEPSEMQKKLQSLVSGHDKMVSEFHKAFQIPEKT